MTLPELQRIAVLKHLGWTNLSRSGLNSALRGTSPTGAKNQLPPNPVTNLNACRELEMTLDDTEGDKYAAELAAACNQDAFLQVSAAPSIRVATFIKVKNLEV